MSILLNAEMQLLVLQYGEEQVKEALIQVLEKDMAESQKE